MNHLLAFGWRNMAVRTGPLGRTIPRKVLLLLGLSVTAAVEQYAQTEGTKYYRLLLTC